MSLTTGHLVLSSTASEADWLAARRHGIGASEIAAVAGLSRRAGPWDVWRSKVEGTELDPTDEMRWGHWIEARIVDWWATETDRIVGNGGLFQSADHEWLLATPDAVVLERPPTGDDLGRGPEVAAVVDAKNAAGWHGADWDEDGAPVDYIAQSTWQMLAVGVDQGYLIAAIGGRPPVERHLSLDEDLAAALIGEGEKFWRQVQERTPPPLDGSASAGRWLRERYPDADPGYFAELSDEDIEQLRDAVNFERSIVRLTLAMTEIENRIKQRLGRAEVGTYRGQPYVTWKSVRRAGYTVGPTSYRRFTIPTKIREELADGHHE